MRVLCVILAFSIPAISNECIRMDDSSEAFDEVVLAIHEWLAISTVIVFFLFLSLVAYIERVDEDVELVALHHLKPQDIEVSIEGAVANPGVYTIPLGSTYSDLFELASPLPFADLRRINLKVSLKSGRRVVVKSLPTIEIEVSGAVERPGKVVVPKGACMFDLARYVIVRGNADVSLFEGRRVLKNGDKVHVEAIVY